MKYLISFLILAICFFSCSKSSSTPPPVTPPEQDSLLNSYSIYYPQGHIRFRQNYFYDSVSQLAGIRAYRYDSSVSLPKTDSFSVVLTLSDPSVPPFSYEFINYSAGSTEHHLLFYDNQKRMTLDSMVSTTGTDYYNLHASYDNNGNSIYNWFGIGVDQIDTMYIANENIIHEIIYSHDNFYWWRVFTPGPRKSPLFQEELANSLGCLLYVKGLGDYRSENLPSQMQDTVVGYGSRDYHYAWSTDAVGRVVEGTASDTDGHIQEMYSFIYNH